MTRLLTRLLYGTWCFKNVGYERDAALEISVQTKLKSPEGLKSSIRLKKAKIF